MANPEKYAQWIVDNQDKKGTEQFNIVAQAYQQAKAAPEPEEKKAPIGSEGTLASALEGATFGFGGEAIAGFRAAGDKLASIVSGEDIDFGEAYEQYNREYDKLVSDFKDQSPGAALTSEVVGALLSPAGIFKLPGFLMQGTKAGQAASAAGKAISATKPAQAIASSPTARAALTGGAAGSLYAAGTAESGERIDAAKDAFIPSMLFGMGGQAVARGVSEKVRQASRASRVKPTLESMRRTSQELYKELDDANVLFSPDDIERLIQRASDSAAARGFTAKTAPKVQEAANVLFANRGKALTFGQLDSIRKTLFAKAKSADAEQSTTIRSIIDDLDGVIAEGPTILKNPRSKPGSLQGDDFVNIANPGDDVPRATQFSEKVKAARAAWSNYKKAETIHEAFEAAALRTASSGSGGNVTNQYRQAIRSILNSKEARFFTEQERQVMEQFVKGSVPQNFLRWLGKLSPSGNGLMLGLHAIGTLNNPATLGLTATGVAAKAASDRATKKGAENLFSLVGGLKPPTPTPFVPIVSPMAGLLSQRDS